ncbi:hypothetical protein F2Q69_00018734 [Brassica cretica]|uniref:Uncharacterized protein n=1 Tax=Brassica cretica TaxID=69181 RepID=A0A8S9QDS7_BRACR|nr:hypothetical protein F2Q69_00018734 [Brassica cretica]
MDSSSHIRPNSHIRPKKPLLVIGSMINSGSSHPKPSGSTSGYSSEPKRDSRNYDDRSNNLPLKKSRTIVDSNNGNKTVIVEPDTPKLSRQYWKAGDDNEDEHVAYCRSDAKVKVNPQFLHANARSHKWALGALAEVLVNFPDELKQSTAKIKDLEKMQNVNDDESAKQVAELQRQKALLEEESKKVKDESAKLVAELQRQRALLEIESEKLKQSEAKNQDLEFKLMNAAEDFFQERAHGDSTEHNLRNKLREAFATIHTLTSKVNRLEAEKR